MRDLDGNGTIDSGRELFGSETLLADGSKAANGYQVLAELDTNLDGQIDAQEAANANIRIWKDANGDGYSSADELLTLSGAGVQSIATGYVAVDQTDANGNVTQQTGIFTRTDGSTGNSADIWFKIDKTNTIATDWLPETAAVAALPDLQGYGNMRDLHQAILKDGTGHLQDLVQQFVDATDPAARHALTTQLIYAWAGVENIDPASRAARMIYGNAIGDARKLATLETIMGEPYVGTWCWGERDPNPHGPASRILLQAFNEFADSVYSQLMSQTHFKPLLNSIGVTWDAATNQFGWDTANTVAALQSLYTADPTGSTTAFREFADVLKLSGDSGTQVLDALRAQGDASGDAFAQMLAGIGIDSGTGLEGNDFLYGSPVNDTLSGMGGNDDIYGNVGNDVLIGGAGDDTLQGGTGYDVYQFNLGDGKDIIFELDYMTGNVDTLRFGAGITANDVTVTQNGYDMVFSINGTTDQIVVQNWGGGIAYQVERLEFADGSTLDSSLFQFQRIATEGDDNMYAWSQGDTLVGKGGADKLYGGTGDDSLYGDDGNDTLWGAEGNDTLVGGAGDDHIVGSEGVDVLQGGDGNDQLFGDSDQTLVANQGNDFIDGGAGDDYLRSYGGDDVLLGGDGNDMMLGEAGIDSLDGGAGADVLDGGAGSDTLVGGAGNDGLIGGEGADMLIGGEGDDTYNVDNVADTIVEAANEGDEYVISTVSYTLGDNVERLGLDRTANIDATGNSQGNGLWGNSGNNVLTGVLATITWLVMRATTFMFSTAVTGWMPSTIPTCWGRRTHCVLAQALTTPMWLSLGWARMSIST